MVNYVNHYLIMMNSKRSSSYISERGLL